jgi:hypothetical protein
MMALTKVERTLLAVESFGGAWASTRAIREQVNDEDVRAALFTLRRIGKVQSHMRGDRLYWRTVALNGERS